MRTLKFKHPFVRRILIALTVVGALAAPFILGPLSSLEAEAPEGVVADTSIACSPHVERDVFDTCGKYKIPLENIIDILGEENLPTENQLIKAYFDYAIIKFETANKVYDLTFGKGNFILEDISESSENQIASSAITSNIPPETGPANESPSYWDKFKNWLSGWYFSVTDLVMSESFLFWLTAGILVILSIVSGRAPTKGALRRPVSIVVIFSFFLGAWVILLGDIVDVNQEVLMKFGNITFLIVSVSTAFLCGIQSGRKNNFSSYFGRMIYVSIAGIVALFYSHTFITEGIKSTDLHYWIYFCIGIVVIEILSLSTRGIRLNTNRIPANRAVFTS